MVDLGRHLFFDARMSEAEDISCASCHDLTLGGSDGRPTSIGRDDRFGARNAPTVLNAALNIDQFWDARAPNLVEQVKGHVLNPIDMAHTQASLFQTLQDIPGYVLRFNSAFPNDAEPLGLNNFATAVAAFETTLITPSRFDAFVAGDTSALTLDEIFGMQVFFDLGCAECHNGVNLGGNSQNYFGIVAEPSNTHRPKDDTGVSAVTGNIHDEYLFGSHHCEISHSRALIFIQEAQIHWRRLCK
jgi:cytochrome c peroxidase